MNMEARLKASEGGLTPLEYLLSVMRNESLDEDKRVDAAKAAAPYIHARLNATTLSGDADKPLTISRIEHVIVDPKG
jgi:hypothetical protein